MSDMRSNLKPDLKPNLKSRLGVVIRATAVHTEPNPIETAACSARAAERCLASAGISATDIDLIINTGVYREQNLAEPALAAFVQKEIGANVDPILNSQGNRTLSFDLLNGPVGLLNAIQVAGAMLANGGRRNILVVSNDVHPSVKTDADFPFSQVGAAVLLGRADEPETGFQRLAFKTTARTDSGFRGFISLTDDCGSAARGFVKIQVEDDYIDRLRKFAVRAAREYLREHTDDGAEITHLLCSRPTASFGVEVAEELSLSPDVVLRDGVEGDPHSSCLAAAYHAGQENGLFKPGDAILFIGAGAGLSCGCGLYRV